MQAYKHIKEAHTHVINTDNRANINTDRMIIRKHKQPYKHDAAHEQAYHSLRSFRSDGPASWAVIGAAIACCSRIESEKAQHQSRDPDPEIRKSDNYWGRCVSHVTYLSEI